MGTIARVRRTFSLRDLCLWRSPSCGECHRQRPNLLSENVKRSRDQVPHKFARRSPTSARDASRQSRVGCRVVSECHRHAIRLRRAGDAYRVDGSLHVDRRAERCSATACAAHVCRRPWRVRQQICPVSFIMSTFELSNAFSKSLAFSTGIQESSLPHKIWVGVEISSNLLV